MIGNFGDLSPKSCFVEEKLWFAVNSVSFTKIRNSTENLEFHDFHEIQHKNDDFLLDFIRVSRYG